jgi:ubiquinone biosynthesis protein UbiJ
MLTSAVENLLNRNLGASPRARELCADLAGRRLAIEVRGTPWRFTVESLGLSIQLARAAPFGGTESGSAERGAAESETTADAHVSGTPFGLAQLARDAPEAVVQRGEVRISGDTETAQKFRELARLLRPDVEEELARMLGDVPAHRVWQLARGAFRWGRRAADTTVRNVAEYLAHERRDLVPRAEAEVFLQGVDRLREDVDRLEARLALLERPAADAPAAGEPGDRA